MLKYLSKIKYQQIFSKYFLVFDWRKRWPRWTRRESGNKGWCKNVNKEMKRKRHKRKRKKRKEKRRECSFKKRTTFWLKDAFELNHMHVLGKFTDELNFNCTDWNTGSSRVTNIAEYYKYKSWLFWRFSVLVLNYFLQIKSDSKGKCLKPQIQAAPSTCRVLKRYFC